MKGFDMDNMTDEDYERAFEGYNPGKLSHETFQAIAAIEEEARARESATATAMVSAAIYSPDLTEREDWAQLPGQLAKLEIIHLRMLAELKEPVVPKLAMLTDWRPRSAADETVRLAATSVLNEKIAARERSHARVLAWIAVAAGLAGIALGKWVL